jgi:hypothetical protein
MRMRTSIVKRLVLMVFFLSGGIAFASDNADAEVQHLLTTIGKSGCTFVRNGKEYTSVEAQDHLAMKYRRGKRYAKTADDFISRLASESSWSGKPYTVSCPAKPTQTSREWLTGMLMQHRAEGSVGTTEPAP